MTRVEAEEYAKNMTYRDAVINALSGRAIPYRKATMIKLHELLTIVEHECYACKHCNETDGEYCYECVKGMTDNFEVNEVKDDREV